MTAFIALEYNLLHVMVNLFLCNVNIPKTKNIQTLWSTKYDPHV